MRYNDDMAKDTEKMHNAQLTTLKTLEHATRARFSELMRAAGVQSDSFKFHVKSLIKDGLIFKDEDTLYGLTAEGKELVGRLDRTTRRQIEQPKSSMLMIVMLKDGRVLGHMRTREPFNGFWGIASAPMLRGVPAVESARRELKKQTGIDAQFSVQGVCRVIDKDKRGTVLEDKLFCVAVSVLPAMQQPHVWCGGVSEWMRVSDLLAKPKLFPTTEATLAMVADSISFREDTCAYADEEY